MRLRLNPTKEELIKNMLKSGMRVGEIQVIFPYINCTTIHKFGRNLGIDTRQNKKDEEKRDIQAIKKLIEEALEDEIITKTPKLEVLLENIEELPPKRTRRIYNIREELKIENVENTETTPFEVKKANEGKDTENER